MSNFQHNVTSCQHGKVRAYRFNIDETRSNPVSKLSGEYYHEKLEEWRPIVNWATREALYNEVTE